MFRSLTLCLVLLNWFLPAQVSAQVGYVQLTLPATASARVLSVAILYPTEALQPQSMLADNAVFVGESVVERAVPKPGQHPLVVISHGYGGNWRNQLWLAKALAQQGYVVAAPNHPGTTSRDRNPVIGAQLWLRPADISQVIDFMTSAPDWQPLIAPQNIAAIGHSLGGWTVLELMGARFDAQRLQADCLAHAWLASCKVMTELGAGQNESARAALNQALQDKRVRAVVSLDLGLARSFDPASLAAITTPSLIVAAGPRTVTDMPSEMESAYMVKQMPVANTHYVQVLDAAHFSFMQRCKPNAKALLDEETPGDGVICDDAGGLPREAIHTQLTHMVIEFLHSALPKQ